MKQVLKVLALFLTLSMVAAACGGDDDAVSEAASDAADAVDEVVDGDEEEALSLIHI